ncbi:Hypothetical protein PHPALM_6181 [Phytophthora palmivora]|uniref:Uncharacterized protein n=1 Tax=Phytophthora palmivora TaxID=4796 RepID=A0A2P4YFI8_9STRA|nr:Hypothetical protein PHPALM_6181 [Phytophthora palmivora]
MLVYLYVNARCSSDYQDAALICLLWYLFGRASDLALLRKPNISIDAGNVLFIPFIRIKTSEEQGLSLFPGTDFETCPMLAMALAILIQTTPSTDVIDNLPEMQDQAAITLSPSRSWIFSTTLLTQLDLAHRPLLVLRRRPPSTHICADIPFLPTRGAQHANGRCELTARWIFDRGAWNMSTTNEGFNYIFNTSKEDHMVNKILSGHDTSTNVTIQDLRSFDSQTRSTISSLQQHLFSTCHDLQAAQHDVNQAVLDVLTSTVIRHYPLLKCLNAEVRAIKRIEACTAEAGCSLVELLAWSSHLANPELPCDDSKPSSAHQTFEKSLTRSTEQKVIDHQAAVINHFIEHVKLQEARTDALEAKMNGPRQGTHKRQKSETSQCDVSQAKKKQRRSSLPHLRATWYGWYAQEPPLWWAPISKQQT